MKNAKPFPVPVRTYYRCDKCPAYCCTYTEIEPNRRLVYENAVDFVPGVPPYTATTRVELTPVTGGTRLAVTNDVMHDEMWTERARMGWEQEIGKLERALG